MNDITRWILAGAVAVGLAIVLAILYVSRTTGLDFETTSLVLQRLAGVTLCWICVFYFLGFASMSRAWPLVLASLWWCGWPALSYYSGLAEAHMLAQFGTSEPMWYARWLSRWGILCSIVIVPYSVESWLRRE